jgi:hypothetical protein
MGIFHRISAWWNKDRTELTDEEEEMSEPERETLDKDYEARKDDQSIGGSYAGGAGLGYDFERDSEPPPR